MMTMDFKNNTAHLRTLVAALLAVLFFNFPLYSQKKPKKENPTAQNADNKEEDEEEFSFELDENATPTIELNPYKEKEEEQKKVKKKKRKRKVFYGIKTKKRYIKTRKGRNTTIEIFHVLPEYDAPNKYMGEKYYFDPDKKEIVKSFYSHKKYGLPLHGEYKKYINDEMVLYGIFYKGGKHGRWEQFGGEGQLLDKKKFYEGFPKEAEITYYDGEQTKVKEVIPYHYGKRDGLYLKYYESGRIMEKGTYKEDVKVGRWNEYYDRWDRNRKKETQYRHRPFDEDFEPFVMREWDEKGEQTVNNSKNSRKFRGGD